MITIFFLSDRFVLILLTKDLSIRGKDTTILKNKYATEAKLKKIDDKVKKKIKECEEFAESSPFPDISLLYDSVYEQKDYPFIKHKID